MDNNVLLSIASIGVLGIACQWFAWWVRIPSILFLLTAGILAGPVLNLLNPDVLFGNLLFPFISLSVAVILFEGSLTLKFEDIRGHGKTVSNLVTIGALITWVIIGYSTYRLLNLPIELAFLFGAIVVGSSAFGQAGLREALERLDINQNGQIDPSEICSNQILVSQINSTEICHCKIYFP